MSEFQQVEYLTSDGLRSELRNFAMETLQRELSQQSKGIHEDLQKMLLELQETLLEQLLAGRKPALKGLMGGSPGTGSQLRGAAAGEDVDATIAVSVDASKASACLPGAVVTTPVSDDDVVQMCSCGSAFLDDSVFCRKCGIARPNACSFCRSILKDDAEFCKQCGKKRLEALSRLKELANGMHFDVNGKPDIPKMPRDSKPRRSSSPAVLPTIAASLPSMEEDSEPCSPTRSNQGSSRVISSAKAKNEMGKGSGKAAFSAKAGSGKTRMRVISLCNHVYFDYGTAALILLNGILVGIQTDYMAREHLENAPATFEGLEYVFCVAFTTELGLRLFAYRSRFFTMGGRGWNIFDFIIVSLQLVEIFLNILASGVGFNFNVLRILRLLRIVRLARALRLIGELRTIVSSIAGSMKPLFWTAILLFMIVYVLGICLTQAVHQEGIRWRKENKDTPEVLQMYWGTLIRSIFSLFESITGGVDWDEIARPLIDHIGPEWGLLFCGYILFTVLAMLNVVTGVFIDSVMTNASLAKEQETIAHVQNLFNKLDIDHSGEITWEAFEAQLGQKEMRDFFKTIDVDIDKASSLFELLDLDDSGSVDVDEFMDGCLRIWSPAKGLDQRMILRDVNRVSQKLPGGRGGEGGGGNVTKVESDGAAYPPAHYDFGVGHSLGHRGNYEEDE